MPKFLKAISPDSSADTPAKACRGGEWVTAGRFAVCDLAEGFHCDPPCGCDRTFLALDGATRCVQAEVVELSEAELATIAPQLSASLSAKASADEIGAAKTATVAEKEIAFTKAVAGSFETAARIVVKRHCGSDGFLQDEYKSVSGAELPQG